MEVRSEAANSVVSRPGRLLWAGHRRGRLLAIICLHCLPRLVIFDKTGNNFVRGNYLNFCSWWFHRFARLYWTSNLLQRVKCEDHLWCPPGWGWGEYELRYLNQHKIFECLLTSTLNKIYWVWLLFRQRVGESWWKKKIDEFGKNKCEMVISCKLSGGGCGRRGHGSEFVHRSPSWNHTQTLKDCLCFPIYYTLLRAP